VNGRIDKTDTALGGHEATGSGIVLGGCGLLVLLGDMYQFFRESHMFHLEGHLNVPGLGQLFLEARYKLPLGQVAAFEFCFARRETGLNAACGLAQRIDSLGNVVERATDGLQGAVWG
jgi:hypothetical protein